MLNYRLFSCRNLVIRFLVLGNKNVKKKQMKYSYAKYQRIRKNEWEMLFFFYINLAMSFDRFMELLSKLVCVCVLVGVGYNLLYFFSMLEMKITQ